MGRISLFEGGRGENLNREAVWEDTLWEMKLFWRRVQVLGTETIMVKDDLGEGKIVEMER